MDRVSCTWAMLYPLLYSHDDPLISPFFSKDVIFQGVGYTSGTSGNAGSWYPGVLEGTKANKRDVIQVTKPGGHQGFITCAIRIDPAGAPDSNV